MISGIEERDVEAGKLAYVLPEFEIKIDRDENKEAIQGWFTPCEKRKKK